jgi:hypothetical protein
MRVVDVADELGWTTAAVLDRLAAMGIDARSSGDEIPYPVARLLLDEEHRRLAFAGPSTGLKAPEAPLPVRVEVHLVHDEPEKPKSTGVPIGHLVLRTVLVCGIVGATGMSMWNDGGTVEAATLWVGDCVGLPAPDAVVAIPDLVSVPCDAPSAALVTIGVAAEDLREWPDPQESKAVCHDATTDGGRVLVPVQDVIGVPPGHLAWESGHRMIACLVAVSDL